MAALRASRAAGVSLSDVARDVSRALANHLLAGLQGLVQLAPLAVSLRLLDKSKGKSSSGDCGHMRLYREQIQVPLCGSNCRLSSPGPSVAYIPQDSGFVSTR
jgi:hypothetical protein